jgi:hypothetical protein
MKEGRRKSREKIIKEVDFSFSVVEMWLGSVG